MIITIETVVGQQSYFSNMNCGCDLLCFLYLFQRSFERITERKLHQAILPEILVTEFVKSRLYCFCLEENGKIAME